MKLTQFGMHTPAIPLHTAGLVRHPEKAYKPHRSLTARPEERNALHIICIACRNTVRRCITITVVERV
jgi:hypothetical protein